MWCVFGCEWCRGWEKTDSVFPHRGEKYFVVPASIAVCVFMCVFCMPVAY